LKNFKILPEGKISELYKSIKEFRISNKNTLTENAVVELKKTESFLNSKIKGRIEKANTYIKDINTNIKEINTNIKEIDTKISSNLEKIEKLKIEKETFKNTHSNEFTKKTETVSENGLIITDIPNNSIKVKWESFSIKETEINKLIENLNKDKNVLEKSLSKPENKLSKSEKILKKLEYKNLSPKDKIKYDIGQLEIKIKNNKSEQNKRRTPEQHKELLSKEIELNSELKTFEKKLIDNPKKPI
jgi:chromosome segregation ATPase